ncbi:hypothetical protein [Alkalicoccus daliensis]|uniref:Uncharacterized protein n=1 Tax=Alkalicoccus daliensis TaxID=745820 RepID=A0A1H0CRI1_9BACI|nr:hypothetical protein [Alkalicoccus daliensis]SDN60476.1 hypothetical protein SAMN04488053_102202 [Alkalicoccus daliensis]
MNRLVMWIGITIFLGWTAAMIVNYGIYSQDPGPAVITPFFDGILFMALMLGMYFLIYYIYQTRRRLATMILSITGAVVLVFAVLMW